MGLYLTFLKLWFTQEFIYVEVYGGNEYYCRIAWVWLDAVSVVAIGPANKDEVSLVPFSVVAAINPDNEQCQRNRLERIYKRADAIKQEPTDGDDPSLIIH